MGLGNVAESRSMGQLCQLSGEMELELGGKPRHDCGTITHSRCRRLGKHWESTGVVYSNLSRNGAPVSGLVTVGACPE